MGHGADAPTDEGSGSAAGSSSSDVEEGKAAKAVVAVATPTAGGKKPPQASSPPTPSPDPDLPPSSSKKDVEAGDDGKQAKGGKAKEPPTPRLSYFKLLLGQADVWDYLAMSLGGLGAAGAGRWDGGVRGVAGRGQGRGPAWWHCGCGNSLVSCAGRGSVEGRAGCCRRAWHAHER